MKQAICLRFIWRRPTRLELVLIAAILCPLGCSPGGGTHVVPDDVACGRRLERLWKAMANYRATNGRWPEDVTTSEGHTHSWRVLIAPFCVPNFSSSEEVYASIGYRFDEPWDSERNTDAIHELPCGVSLYVLASQRCPTTHTRRT
jgi:hypothetical protein